MMYWNADGSWGAWLVMTLMMVGLWVVVAWAIVAASRAPGSSGSAAARQLLDERLARGDITVEEYRSVRQALGDATPPTGRPARSDSESTTPSGSTAEPVIAPMPPSDVPGKDR